MKFKESEKEEKQYYFDYNDSRGRKQICGKKMHETPNEIIVKTGVELVKIEKNNIQEQREISKDDSLGDVFGFQIRETINSTKVKYNERNYDINKTQDLKDLSGILFDKLGLNNQDLLKIQSIMLYQGDAVYAATLVAVIRSTIKLSMSESKDFIQTLNKRMEKYFNYIEGEEADICTVGKISGINFQRIYLDSLKFLSS